MTMLQRIDATLSSNGGGDVREQVPSGYIQPPSALQIENDSVGYLPINVITSTYQGYPKSYLCQCAALVLFSATFDIVQRWQA